MRAKLAIWIALGVWVLAGLGCSSLAARTKPRETKFYPGVHHFGTASGSADADRDFVLLYPVDLALSAAVDTLLLPVDAFYRPKRTRPESPEYIEGTYAGLFRFGFERSDFTRVGTRERWWLTGDIADLTGRIARPSLDKPAELRNPVFLVVEGELSEPGYYGHLGAYRRELRVIEVLEIKQMSPDER